jgi:hypothetical protein
MRRRLEQLLSLPTDAEVFGTVACWVEPDLAHLVAGYAHQTTSELVLRHIQQGSAEFLTLLECLEALEQVEESVESGLLFLRYIDRMLIGVPDKWPFFTHLRAERNWQWVLRSRMSVLESGHCCRHCVMNHTDLQQLLLDVAMSTRTLPSPDLPIGTRVQQACQAEKRSLVFYIIGLVMLVKLSLLL